MHALLLNPRVSLWPIDPTAARRGHEAAQAGDWPRAAVALRLAVHQPSASPDVRGDLLLAQAAAEQQAEARQAVADLAALLATVKDPAMRTRLLHRAVNLPSDEPTSRLLAQQTAAALSRQQTAQTLHRHGVALFRAGRHDEAAKLLAASVKAQGKGGFVDTWLYQSLMAREQGRLDEAASLLARFEAWHGKQKFADWRQRVFWELLLREARTPPRMRPLAAEAPEPGGVR